MATEHGEEAPCTVELQRGSRDAMSGCTGASGSVTTKKMAPYCLLFNAALLSVTKDTKSIS